MRTAPPAHTLLAVAAGFAWLPTLAASGAETPGPINLETDSGPGYNRVAVSYRPAFNVSVSFENVGSFAALNRLKTTPSGDFYNYDDGYVLRDISKSTQDTWYWGHENAGADQNVVSLHRSYAEPVDASSDDVHQGAEMTYWRRLGLLANGHWGFVCAFNFNSIEYQERGPFSISAFQRTDNYAALAPPPPAPPYYGTYEGPVPGGPARPLISLKPTSSTVASLPGGATVSGEHTYEAELFGLRLGPYFELPLARRLTLSLSGGLALGWLHGDYSFEETTTLTSLGSVSEQGSSTETELLVGGFAAAELWYALSQDWSAFVGVQYQYLGSSTQRASDKEVTVDLGESVFMTVGLGYAF
jgi:hypothetical protein